MTSSQQQLFRYLEDRFACAQACTECARVCAVRAARATPDGSTREALLRRRGIMCAEVCEATCRALSDQSVTDEDGIRVQLEWCRTVCLECAEVFDGRLGAEDGAKACREAAQACTDLLAALD
ncbi:ferredoxin [Streptomyces sp. NPDC000983]|uniref:ferredoxin n=1 Tax=Streptomyces sp. NPDC000983 TaxID=3154373 RepID=UPI003323C999